MKNTVQTEETYAIIATSSRLSETNRVLKHGESFAVFDRTGGIEPGTEQGLYHEGTRFLSRLDLLLESQRPLFLGSCVRQDNALVVDLTNPDIVSGHDVLLCREAIHLFGTIFLWDEVCYLRWRLRNFSLEPAEVRLHLRFGADFADIFEVRGTARERRGSLTAPEAANSGVTLGYQGLDGVSRRTRLRFSPAAEEASGGGATFHARLPPMEEAAWTVTIELQVQDRQPTVFDFCDALARSEAQLQARRMGSASIQTSNGRFDEWIERSLSDLHMMLTDTTRGPYPYAGIPWFSTVFGRDGILTALEMLWLDPAPARGVLGFLADHQAGRVHPDSDAEPGKILHEMRLGEMAALGEIPFGRYYGSVDSTPLFVMLAGAYLQRTGDLAFVETLWPHVERALGWIDHYGDLDGDGFVEYARHSPNGLLQQGWKDSHDSVFHADGRLAEAPIAVCEVQGYVYAARRAAAEIAAALGRAEQAAELERKARELQRDFEEAFWIEELGTYALALDGQKRPCAVRSSNAGHCLFTGIASHGRARRVAETLLSDTSFSGWGIRTLDSREKRYNPMAYHNGSVWPHDNALIAMGLSRYGFKRQAAQVLSSLFDATLCFDQLRVPELFCGFHRRPHQGPVLYPVACSPQAWSGAAVFLLLQACLGLEIDAPAARIRLQGPDLPDFLKIVHVNRLSVGGATVDLTLERYALDVGTRLERREGEVEVVVVK